MIVIVFGSWCRGVIIAINFGVEVQGNGGYRRRASSAATTTTTTRSNLVVIGGGLYKDGNVLFGVSVETLLSPLCELVEREARVLSRLLIS